MDETLRLWGTNIRNSRRGLGFNQTQLAEMLDPPVTQGTIARWERGQMEPRRHHKAQLASILQCDVRLLFPLTRGAA